MRLILENGMAFEEEVLESRATSPVKSFYHRDDRVPDTHRQSYHGQIVVQTFSIGNYGIIPGDFEGETVGPLGYIVKTPCPHPFQLRSEGTLDDFGKKASWAFTISTQGPW